MILLVGGSGTLGSALVSQLVAAGQPVTVMSRNPKLHAGRFPAAVALVEGDLRDKDSLQQAVSGKTQVVAAAHSILGRGREASRFVDGRGMENLIDACVAAGTKRFVYVSAWFEHHKKLNAFFTIKHQLELYLKHSGLTHTILQPTAFMETHAEQLIGLRMQANQPIIIFGTGLASRNFVAAADVAKVIVKELEASADSSQTLTVGGPQNLSTMDVIDIYRGLFNSQSRVMHAPLGVASFMHWATKPMHPGLSQIMDITRYVERHGDGFRIEDNPDCEHNTPFRAWAQDRAEAARIAEREARPE